MKITKNKSEHGQGFHCCDCGSHQPKFDELQHVQYCDKIRVDQQWTTCRYCFSDLGNRPLGALIAQLNDLAQLCFDIADEKGWHDEPREFGTSLLLVDTEITEAFEEWRNGHQFDEIYYNPDKPDKPEGISIEMADAMIRILHTAAWYGMDIKEAMRLKMRYNATRPHRHGGKKA